MSEHLILGKAGKGTFQHILPSHLKNAVIIEDISGLQEAMLQAAVEVAKSERKEKDA
jgi:hypothetical protein